MKPVEITGIEQGSDAWFNLRRGIPTASEFDNLITAKTYKPSKGEAYLSQKISESFHCDPSYFTTEYTDRGTRLEPKARAWYEFETSRDVREVSFVYRSDERDCGCSPDGLIDGEQGDNGGSEFKALKGDNHFDIVRFARNQTKGYEWRSLFEGGQFVPWKYRPQVFGCLLITDRDWWDFCAYHPQATIYQLRVRVTRDDPEYVKWRNLFTPILDEFLERLASERAGYIIPKRRGSNVFTNAELDKFERQAARAQAKDAEKNKLLSSFVDTTAAKPKS